MTRNRLSFLVTKVLFSALMYAALFGGPILLLVLVGERFH